MITEYVYENQEYENVLVKIKAALMDIISSEENKLYEIEQKITTTTDEDFKEKLSKLCADERSALRQIIITMNTLSASLEKVDSYSKDLDSIEDENIKEIIADLKNGNINNISDSINSPVYQQEETIESVNQDPDVVRKINDYTDSNEEPVVEENIEQVPEESTPQVEPSKVQEETIENATPEPVMTEEQVEPTETIINAEEEVPEVNQEVQNEEQVYEEQPIETPTDNTELVQETPEDATVYEEQQEVQEPQIEQVDDENQEEVVTEQPSEQINQEVQNEEQVYEEQPTETPTDNTELVQEEPEDTMVYEEQQEVQEPQIEQADEENQEEVAPEQPSEQVSQGENTPLIPIVTEETEQQQPSEETEEQVSPEITEEGVVAPPSITTDTQQQEEFAPSIPAIENQEEVTYQEDLKKEPLMTFIKASQDPPKAILTSLKQVTNLRMSYQTQNALLSSRGTIASRNVNGVDSEVQELVDNGLLAPSPENIEAMMNEANKLYQEGKINEAQEMYDQISVLNKQLQESNAVVK